MHTQLPDAELIGRADIRALGFRLYTTSLYAPDPAPFDWTYPFALHLDYNRGFSQSLLVGATMFELERLEGPQDDHREIETALRTCFQDVTAQDAYSALAPESGRLRFFLNDQKTCELAHPNISERLLGIWLSDEARSPALSRQLRGK